MKTSLEHLPESKSAQISAIAALLQTEAPVDMVILFGSFARGDWVEDRENGYFSDFDILLIVATEQIARNEALWSDLTQRARLIAGDTPVRLIVHDIKEINQEIRVGQYFFIDILREGVRLFDSRRVSLATPKALEPKERLQLGLVNFRYWFGSANEFWRIASHSAGRGLGPHAAFLLHQSVERYFAATLLVFTGYKPKSHSIEELANLAAPLNTALAGALPRTEPEDKRLFDLLKRAYIDARYSKSYRITAEELGILRERVHDLATRVRQACAEQLASFCGPDDVGSLPEVPSVTDLGDLPETPTTDDPSAFEAWKQALLALSFERGQQQGREEGFDLGQQRGIEQGITEGQVRALFTILDARNITVDAEARSRIEACRESELLNQWIGRAAKIASIAELFAPEQGSSEGA